LKQRKKNFVRKFVIMKTRVRESNLFINATRSTVNLRTYENVCSRRLESIKSVDKVVR